MSRIARTLVGLSALLLLAEAHAQPPQPPSPPGPLDAAARATAVKGAADALRQRYVYPDVGERAAQALEASLAAGKYDEIVEPAAFAERLTTDLQAIAHDKHMRVAARGTPLAPPGAPTGPPPRGEGGVARADRLPGNVGYIEVVSLPPPDVFKGPLDRAMAPLKDTRALILDLRRNGGGTPAAEVYLASYFVDPAKPVAVNKFMSRNPGTDTFRTEEFKNSQTPYFYSGKPVYVLTSGFTFSGGEAVAYDLQSLKLAKTVGDVTGGGANPGGMAPIAPDFGMFVPMGRPKTRPPARTGKALACSQTSPRPQRTRSRSRSGYSVKRPIRPQSTRCRRRAYSRREPLRIQRRRQRSGACWTSSHAASRTTISCRRACRSSRDSSCRACEEMLSRSARSSPRHSWKWTLKAETSTT